MHIRERMTKIQNVVLIVFENTQGIVFPNALSNEYFSIAERANAISLLRRALQSYNGIILK